MQRLIESKELPLSNAAVADLLEEAADLLEEQTANPFRIQAYRAAAQLLREMSKSVYEILRTEGLDGLERFPGIGQSLARSIEQLTLTGRFGLLDRLRGRREPERLFMTVAGIGPGLAGEIHEQLGIESLQDLEIAAYDGRLATVPGMGQKRLRSVREALAGRFRRRPQTPEHRGAENKKQNEPEVSELLDVDTEYRQKAEKHRLPLIAPKRFNPTAEAWLPVLHTERAGHQYTALYSNTARAHELGTVRDWVVIYRDDHAGQGQWTVVTGRFGQTAGKRIVRGRERECAEYYGEAHEANREKTIAGIRRGSKHY